MISPSTASLFYVVLFTIGLAHSSTSLFGTGNVYVAFSLNSDGSATLYDLNVGYSLNVNYLSWGSFSNAIVQTVLNQTTGDAILYGQTVSISVTTYYFQITKVFVVLPGSTASVFDAYFTATASEATTVNTGDSVSINSIDLELGIPFLDQDWVSYRITTNNAIVQGHVTPSTGTPTVSGIGKSLVADRIFISLPDQTTLCFAVDPIPCNDTSVFTYDLTPNRCLVPTSPPCTLAGACPLFVPFCPPPYFLFSFPTTPNGCNKYYCFPQFVNLH